MNKKHIVIIVAVVLAVAILTTGLSLYFTRYQWDTKDTTDLYMQNIAKVGYENTIETAIPQTELYDLVNNHFNSALAEGKTVKKAIIIGYDGCRADILAEARDEKSAINLMLADGASINLAYCGGINYPATNVQDTSTAPGWCSILTGEWANVTGVTANGITKSMDTKTLLTSLTENGTIDKASFITKWGGHFTAKNSTYKLEKEYCEQKGLNVNFNKCENDEASHVATLAEVSSANCADFTFVIYEPTDSTGHNKGFSFNNPKYKEAFRQADEYGYETIQAIKNRSTYATEDWLIIITSDHGGIKTKHGGPSIHERMTFIVTNA